MVCFVWQNEKYSQHCYMHLLAQHVQEMDQKTNLKQSIIKQKQTGTPKNESYQQEKKVPL